MAFNCTRKVVGILTLLPVSQNTTLNNVHSEELEYLSNQNSFPKTLNNSPTLMLMAFISPMSYFCMYMYQALIWVLYLHTDAHFGDNLKN